MKRVKFEINPTDQISGVKVMSLVDVPAMQSEFVAFSEEKEQYVELKVEGYKQVVAGLALIPDKDFLRKTPEGEPYYAYFTKESVEAIRNKFHKEQMTANVNVDHSQTDFVDAYLIESFIVDSNERLADLKAKGIKDPVIGSWFVAYKIEDEKTFKMVLDGKLKGFSVEIFVRKVFKAVAPAIPNESVEGLQKQIDELKLKLNLNSDVIFGGKDISYLKRRLQLNQNKLKTI